ncbi:hypothetical protein A3715_10960 [Oleiphilus sp. HI0009]|uniref:DNA polymerase III subunit chi n=1 Tax=unclassified Oleiphilus TaxID=2631174 RepID=UPI0007C27B68|nr:MULTISPECIES: DNA polymerase III subunit chi [unclassified Oleiphilus]KZX78044.1 hypothetical protein A3715_10960 [Oleiphilus sp. HI0009]MCH2159297.1 DNA polymerase III subunit chi [Oleiphilaceae bacterium]KZY66149.1 hypothetical protein A3738_07250 [Oleiphilus sp. HI0066]KZY71245.1 hypothetical protein A3739_17090 [Oleiphilus sp. HI0067]KZY71381.1 hypothetical protein A3738_23855 [Oleiphilus sp. HI0066]
MHKQTDIYISKGNAFSDLASIACRIAEKAIAANQTILFVCESDIDAKSLDELLWSYRESSFLPHQQSVSPSPSYPIAIASSQGANDPSFKATDTNICVYLGPTKLAEEPQMKRRMFIVRNDQKQLESARALFKQLKSNGEDINTHDLRR